jgi:hypothetical protein
MGDLLCLRSAPVDLASEAGHQFVVDCTRAAEGLITDKELQEIYELTPADWIAITKDQALGRAIRVERDRRVKTGVAAREAAAKYFVRAPSILDAIMTDQQSNPRHKIEAIKELRQTAIGDKDDRPAAADRFVITINLGTDADGKPVIEHYDKPFKTIDAIDENGASKERFDDDSG